MIIIAIFLFMIVAGIIVNERNRHYREYINRVGVIRRFPISTEKEVK
jgi:hypothetical protein